MTSFFHICTEACLCPIHGQPMLYAPKGRLHACRRPDCRYAHGFENHVYVETATLPFDVGFSKKIIDALNERARAQGWTAEDLATCEQRITTTKDENGDYIINVTLEKKR